MTVKVYFNDLETAEKVNEVVRGQLNTEEASIDLETTCPHEAEKQIKEEISATKYSVAVVE
jgi:hypothetical protein